MSNDISRAKEVLPLPRLAQKLGFHRATLDKGAECPWCKDTSGKFKIYQHNSKWYFKCQSTSCQANAPATGHNEIGFICLALGHNENEAIDELMRLAAEIDPSLAPKPSSVSSPARQREKEEPSNPWEDLHRKLILTPEHKESLKIKRGLSDETIKQLGFRSSLPTNGALVESLKDRWGEDLLVELGILKRDRRGVKPNPQLTGLGVSGTKDSDGNPLMEFTQPIIIPYLDVHGRPFYLRPHKGGLKRTSHDEYFKSSAGGHVYCPFLIENLVAESDGTCIVTEGEFKAAALWQARVAAVAIPGIQFTRSKAGDITSPEQLFRTELVKVLRDAGVTDVVVVFDNEIKDDPLLKSYKQDPWDRYDTAVWAEYLAYDLRDEFDSVRLGYIPDEWRVDGKADFDSALAGFVHGVTNPERHQTFNFGHGMTEGTRRYRSAVQKIIGDAGTRADYQDLFPSAARRIIDCKLERLFYKKKLSEGGDNEEKLARRFAELDQGGVPIDSQLAEAFRSVVGVYYERKRPDKDTVKRLSSVYKDISKRISEIEEGDPKQRDFVTLKELRSKRAAVMERLKGIPEDLSDFTLRCEFKLHTTEGTVIRLVRMRNCHGESSDRLIRLSGEQMSRSSTFRNWAYDTGKGVPKFGEKQLQLLVQDMDHHSAFRDIYEVDAYGYHKATGLWFFGDCAFDPDGKLLGTDKHGIVWHDGFGYQIEGPSENEQFTGFEQGEPLLLSPQEGDPSDISPKELFEAMYEDMFELVGGFDALMMLGIIFAYGSAPELLRHPGGGGHPGLWVYGKMSSGKTTIVRMLMKIWGFKHLEGLRIDDSMTHVAMGRVLNHYCCLPVFFDEYRSKNMLGPGGPQKESMLRGAYDRSAGPKGDPKNPTKTRLTRANTTPIVSGESSSSDSATRSRFGHVNIAETRRLENNKKCFLRAQDMCRHYHKLGRFIMENRREYSRRLIANLSELQMSASIRDRVPNERVRFTHMTGVAGFNALAQMLVPGWNMPAFTEAIVDHAANALADVQDETFLNQFWRDVISALHRSESGVKAKFFKLRAVDTGENGTLVQGSAMQVVYMVPGPVYDAYAADIRKQGRSPSLSQNDLRREMSKEPYWIANPTDSSRVHKTKMGDKSPACWVINLEEECKFPFIDELTSALDGGSDD